jgi:hypothetical protein
MQAKLIRSYRSSKTGNTVFVYGVTGTKAEIASFQEIQGEFYVEDAVNGPLWFTTKCVGQQCPLIITSNGRICADTSAFDQAASLAAQYGGNLGQEHARAAAQQLMGNKNPIAHVEPVNDLIPDETSLEL